MNKNFHIATLSDNTRLAQVETIIGASVSLLGQLFPNIFGSGRKALTESDWMQLLPGSGYWTVKLRNYLKSKIHYNTDAKNITPFTNYFVDENLDALAPGSRGQSNAIQIGLNNLNKLMQSEKAGTGTGYYPPGVGGIPDWLVYGGLGLLALLLIKK